MVNGIRGLPALYCSPMLPSVKRVFGIPARLGLRMLPGRDFYFHKSGWN